MVRLTAREDDDIFKVTSIDVPPREVVLKMTASLNPHEIQTVTIDTLLILSVLSQYHMSFEIP